MIEGFLHWYHDLPFCDINRGDKQLKSFRVIGQHSVGPEKRPDPKRTNKRRTELVVGKIQVNILRGKSKTELPTLSLKSVTLPSEYVEYEINRSYDTGTWVRRLTHVVDNV